MNVISESIANLRHTDITIFDSLKLHERALVEHRKLHRNLTVLSDGVSASRRSVKQLR